MAKRKHRAYENDYPSVTQCLDQLRKIGLEYWFKVNTPEYIAKASQKGKDIGTSTHEAIENYINTGSLAVDTEYPTEVTTALNSFVMFRKDHPEIKLKQSELRLTSEVYKFNGTLDLMAEVDGVLMVGDWKTGEAKEADQPKIYDEYVYQVAAYVKLYNEVNNANIDRAFIVSLAKDKVAYNIKFIEKEEIEGSFNEVFLSALKIVNYKKGHKNG
jgi:CRISPR/Cas system-associated exonuclease Cas4 (RecB family)